ncbi:unnamed protein product [Phytophthora lilii]|uniref:Unnamed protein product n=1 Tax=Phytophthora lilii TaxID=2077276 RepID=A0A9W6TVQ8_9STRA|nr:unnamed protein product [Phytophthora lilii]
MSEGLELTPLKNIVAQVILQFTYLTADFVHHALCQRRTFGNTMRLATNIKEDAKVERVTAATNTEVSQTETSAATRAFTSGDFDNTCARESLMKVRQQMHQVQVSAIALQADLATLRTRQQDILAQQYQREAIHARLCEQHNHVENQLIEDKIRTHLQIQ